MVLPDDDALPPSSQDFLLDFERSIREFFPHKKQERSQSKFVHQSVLKVIKKFTLPPLTDPFHQPFPSPAVSSTQTISPGFSVKYRDESGRLYALMAR